MDVSAWKIPSYFLALKLSESLYDSIQSEVSVTCAIVLHVDRHVVSYRHRRHHSMSWMLECSKQFFVFKHVVCLPILQHEWMVTFSSNASFRGVECAVDLESFMSRFNGLTEIRIWLSKCWQFEYIRLCYTPDKWWNIKKTLCSCLDWIYFGLALIQSSNKTPSSEFLFAKFFT